MMFPGRARYIDGINVGVLHEGRVVAVGALEAVSVRKGARTIDVSRPNCYHPTGGRGQHSFGESMGDIAGG